MALSPLSLCHLRRLGIKKRWTDFLATQAGTREARGGPEFLLDFRQFIGPIVVSLHKAKQSYQTTRPPSFCRLTVWECPDVQSSSLLTTRLKASQRSRLGVYPRAPSTFGPGELVKSPEVPGLKLVEAFQIFQSRVWNWEAHHWWLDVAWTFIIFYSPKKDRLNRTTLPWPWMTSFPGWTLNFSMLGMAWARPLRSHNVGEAFWIGSF